MADKETELLSRVAANHLFLAQFEAFRAVLLTIRSRNPDFARAILQSIVARAGQLDSVLWSHSCDSPALLTFLCALELLQFNDPSSPLWSFNSDTLKLRVEFLLYVHIISSRVSENLRKSIDLEGIENGARSVDSFDSQVDLLNETEELRESSADSGACLRVLDRIYALGLSRLKPDLVVANDGETEGSLKGRIDIDEAELTCLRSAILEYADVFDVLCDNIQKQSQWSRRDDSGLAIALRREDEDDEFLRFMQTTRKEKKGDEEALRFIQRTVQIVHLEGMKESLDATDVDGAISHIQFLHIDHGAEESECSMVLWDLLKRVMLHKDEYGEKRLAMQGKLLSIYGEALSSKCPRLLQIIQAIQDQMLSEEIESNRASSNKASDDNLIPLPLKRLLSCIVNLRSDANESDQTSPLNMARSSCMRDMFHYARVSGLHVLESVLETALSAVKREQLQVAENVLSLFPRLQPLVAVMGWDLLSGKTTARRKLMQLLWTTKSQFFRLEEAPLYNKSDEASCVENLCDSLCYQLDLACFVASFNSGQAWSSKSSLLLSGAKPMDQEEVKFHRDHFVENFVLERLSVQSPLRVLFDVVPSIQFQDAIELISMQPLASNLAAWRRMQDIELMHMRYALVSAVVALGAMERSTTSETESHEMAFYYLEDSRNHLEAIKTSSRKIWTVNIIASLLHMDDLSMNLSTCDPRWNPESSVKCSSGGYADVPAEEGANDKVVSFISLLLDILRQNLQSSLSDQVNALDGNAATDASRALEWRTLTAKRFIEDWEWRLSILQGLLPLSERQWRWKEGLTVLRAAPSKLLNLCVQRAKYDIGEEAVHRFSLSPEDKATLELAEWVDGAFKRSSVEVSMSLAADGTSSVHDLDFSSLRSQLGPLAATLLCVDVAATTVKNTSVSEKLLDQAQIILSEIYPGGSPKMGSTYWDQILEMATISVTKRVLRRLQELLEQENPPTIQSILSGEVILFSMTEFQRQGHKERAPIMLHQMIEDAHKGKRQFLSGKLHNLARAVADEETERDYGKGDALFIDRKNFLYAEGDLVVGLGLRVLKQSTSASSSSESNVYSTGYEAKDAGKRLFAPLNHKTTTYLSQFILYIAAIGDIVDGTDTTHDFNYFSLVYEWPKDLLTRLVFERDSSDAAGKVAEIMCADFVHEVISACVPPVYPPRSGNGWACIPVIPTFMKSYSESKLLSPSAREAKPNTYSCSSATPGVPLYPLKLDIVKHLVKVSPVRAVLACVFGSGILYRGTESIFTSNDGLLQTPDVDRLFYEFALDQSERFPTLNRWIQMQTNLHRVSEFAVMDEHKNDRGLSTPAVKANIKRRREQDNDTDSEIDDISNTSDFSTSVPNPKNEGNITSDRWHDSLKSEASELDNTVFLSFDWENEGPCEKAVDRLIDEGNLMDALALSDRYLRNGASDQLLQLLIEHEEETNSLPGHSQGCISRGNGSNSWQYCLRFKDKQLAARLALKYLHRWELDAALDVLTMCSCHLSENDALRNEVVQRRQALLRYKHILGADDLYNSWQEVEADCREDPEGLALRLAGKGAVSAALKVAESTGLSIELRRELQGRQLVKLLTADPLSGGGPAEASRFLSSLCHSEDALPVAMSAMQLLPNLRSKQLLVHFFLKRRDSNLTEVDVSRLNSWALGLRVLAALPLPWQQRCSSLHEHPHLILEVLLMRKQLQSASQILKEFPSLRDNDVILAYAAKAIVISINLPPREARISVSASRAKQKIKTSTPTRSSFTSSLSNLHKEARRAFSWAPRNSGDKNVRKDVYKKRKSSGLAPSDRVTWEAMTGIQEDRTSLYAVDGQERLASVSIVEEWMLTGDLRKDEVVRSSHKYESAPDINLFKALLSLCSDEIVSVKGALDLCINQMKSVLSLQHLPDNASTETIGRAYHATETSVQGLLFVRSQIRKLSGVSDIGSNSERSRDADDASSDAGSSSVGSQSTDELSEVLSLADIWLGRAELLQSLLGSGIAASLDDIADKESSARLRDRLILEERYSMAVYTSKKCKIDIFPVWNAWGHALIRMEHYAQARVKFKQALQLYKGDPASVVLEIINTMEGGPPADVSSARSMYEHLARSAPAILDDSLSADSYLNVLYMPSTFPRSERSRRLQEAATDNPLCNSDSEDRPASNLDNMRYLECVNYLQEYARQHLLGFMFRHGHYKDACMLLFPSNSVPMPQQPSPLAVVTSSSSPQRPDPLATDYGTIDDLCELCIGYGAMPVLEDVISTRMSSAMQEMAVNQYTTTALARICTYCETHKHFNYLYHFQVIKKDHVAAGLCCIQLFVISSSQEEAIKHLENAKMHFHEGLSARSKAGDSTKLVTKGIRGKSASEKLTEEGLIKFSARVSIQVSVVRCFNDTDRPQWKHSLFGNPNDSETFRRRCEIAEILAEKNFDLAFQVIYEFNLPAVDIYAAVAASLAERKKGGQLTEFFKNIKGTIDDDDWDQVLGAAINVYANKHKERPDRLIDMLTSSHRRVLACVVCGRLKSAFQIASRSGSVADVQYVAHQALHANALPVLDMCKQWLAQYS